MMHLLKSIAYDVAVCMSQLFEYYFYSVFMFFASEEVNVLTPFANNYFVMLKLANVFIKQSVILG